MLLLLFCSKEEDEEKSLQPLNPFTSVQHSLRGNRLLNTAWNVEAPLHFAASRQQLLMLFNVLMSG